MSKSNVAAPVPASSFAKIRDELRRTFRSGKTRPLAYRKQQLAQIAYMIQENSERIQEAIHADTKRPILEIALFDIASIFKSALRAIDQLDEWAAPILVTESTLDDPSHKGWDLRTTKIPRGVVLIAGPWVYPMALVLAPLIGAIAAGCCAVVKPNEGAPAFSALLYELAPKYLDQEVVRVVPGGVDEMTVLLELQWDLIFFTGNERVGRIVAGAAAKHLTPCNLQLGGKIPTIIDDSVTGEELKAAARNILWAKLQAAGGSCMAPDFLIVPKSKHDEIVEVLQATLRSFYPEDAQKSSSYGRIVNETQYKRIVALLEETKGNLAIGGMREVLRDGSHLVEPTIVTGVTRDDILLQEELYAPILSIVQVEDVEEAIDFVNDFPEPLAIYVFSSDDATKKRISESTRSGRVVFNETMGNIAVREVPFGGLGASGYGSQTGRYAFEAFTFNRGYVDVPTNTAVIPALRYPPYTAGNLQSVQALCTGPIPLPKKAHEGLVGELTDKVKHILAL